MATKDEIKAHLKIALHEVGEIKPWFDKEFKVWIFHHHAYPVEYSGDSKKEVLKNYPKYLQEFIEERLNDNLSPLTVKKTKGRGGKREGSGRPKGTVKGPTQRLTLPKPIAEIAIWIRQHPEAIPQVQKLMRISC